jgi:phenylacetate-CoA ligase
MLTTFSRHVAWPLWELDNATRVLPALRELERTQWLSERELLERQWQKLERLLNEAHEHCEYYARLFAACGLRPSRICSPADMAKIPILTKRDIQRNGNALVHRRYDVNQLAPAKTGGSTGTALKIFADLRCRDLRNAAAIRSDRWAGWDLGVKRAALWGNPPVADTLPRKIRSALRDRIVYLDTMKMDDRTMSGFVDRWQRVKPEILFGHSHSLYIWARWLKRQKVVTVRPRGVISTSMMLLAHERRVMEEVFGCSVTDRYGCEEVGLIACECERHAGLHLNIDHLYVEFLREDGSPAAPGEPATLVVTDLINVGMPLIRYKLEDMAVQASQPCACGRGLPMIQGVVGRTADFLIRADGSLVAGVSLIERTLTAIPGIEQMQIVQQSPHEITLHIVRMEGYDRRSEEGLLEEFRHVFGSTCRTAISYSDRIPQHASGKYRFAICNAEAVNH